jgi:hypothetical protein
VQQQPAICQLKTQANNAYDTLYIDSKTNNNNLYVISYAHLLKQNKMKLPFLADMAEDTMHG